MRIEAVPATQEHAMTLSCALSDLDRQEIAVYREHKEVTEETIAESLLGGAQQSVDATALVDADTGFVYAMWGVVELVDVDDEDEVFGCPWLLSCGPEHYSLAVTRELLRATRASIRRWHEWYDRIEGFSWAGAVEHHRLLRKLGFELSEPTTVSATGVDIPPTVMFCRYLPNIKAGEPYYV